jgi:hypothetical protein
MAQTADNRVDHVIPHVATQQSADVGFVLVNFEVVESEPAHLLTT